MSDRFLFFLYKRNRRPDSTTFSLPLVLASGRTRCFQKLGQMDSSSMPATVSCRLNQMSWRHRAHKVSPLESFSNWKVHLTRSSPFCPQSQVHKAKLEEAKNRQQVTDDSVSELLEILGFVYPTQRSGCMKQKEAE